MHVTGRRHPARGGRKSPFYVAANVCAAGCGRNNLKASGLPLNNGCGALALPICEQQNGKMRP
jgi:hypothetical protein